LLALLLAALPGHAQEPGDALQCGATVTGSLAAGETRTFTFEALAGEVVALEAVDVSGAGELLQIRVEGPGLRISTCTGRVEPGVDLQRLPPLAGGVYTVRVSDCLRDSPVEYAVTLSLLSDSRRNCAARLRCGAGVAGDLSVPGEVDALRFVAHDGDLIDLRLENDLDARGGLEVRIFDPTGRPVGASVGPACLPARRVRATVTGEYTVLVNACLGIGSGDYRVNWVGADCPAVRLRGVHSGDEAVEVEVAADGAKIERFTVAGASCGVDSVAGFTLNTDVQVVDGRFAATGTPVVTPDSPRRMRLDVDGVFDDVDGDGTFDQALGGFSFAGDGGRCHFRWVAAALPDTDGDGWSDRAETKAGARVGDADSVPERADAPTTRLSGPGTCRDFVDNDGDGRTDAEDPGCSAASQAPAAPEPRLFAGRHGQGGGVWLERSGEAATVASLELAGLSCLSDRAAPLRLALSAALDGRGRFAAALDEIADAAGVAAEVDGMLLDADGDGVAEQAIGRVALDAGARSCGLSWWATGHLDTDGDGWSDAAERHLGSDPRPLPLGLGGASVPEVRFDAAVAETLGVDVCDDGIDNDGDGRLDAEEFPDCPTSPQVTPTPGATACSGDCNEDGDVTVDEILALVAASLGGGAPPCVAADADRNGSITVDEIVAAVNLAIAGCVG
jgi:hypothetical protein